MTSDRLPLENRVRDERLRRGWSQDELARRSGLSRTGVSAIETQRLVPSAAAALALAGAFSCRVEDLFSLPRAGAVVSWAWAPHQAPCRYWRAEVGGLHRLYPVEASPLGVVPHDGVAHELTGAPAVGPAAGETIVDPTATLVLACCDPAVGLLAAALARASGVRLVALQRSSRGALGLLKQGLVHAAGLHLAGSDHPEGNAAVVRRELGPGHRLVRVARWDEGITFGTGVRLSSVGQAVRSGLRWVGREAGSGARQCLDDLLGDRRAPRRLAHDHRGVATAVRGGWADAGVCLRLVSEEAGLNFLAVREEAYDLCIPAPWLDDRRIQALLAAIRSPAYRRALGELPGYRSDETGELQSVD